MKSQSIMIYATEQVFHEVPGLPFVYFYPSVSITISREEANVKLHITPPPASKNLKIEFDKINWLL